MSARSRALDDLAQHLERLRDGACGSLGPEAPPLYNAYESWDNAAEMTRATAREEAWRARMARRLHLAR